MFFSKGVWREKCVVISYYFYLVFSKIASLGTIKDADQNFSFEENIICQSILVLTGELTIPRMFTLTWN